MGSILNGLALSRLRPFGSTFMVFSDYMKPPIRMSAIMEIPCIWIFTHDSNGVGEDGPTHQPIEQLSALRAVPGLLTFRPCDANECLEMWKFIAKLTHDPVAVVLTRQPVPTLDRSIYGSACGISRGGYMIAGVEDEDPDLIMMSTGSEVALMLEAHEALRSEGVKVRSLSIPCMELFERQPQEYIDNLLPNSCRARLSIEAATRDTLGASAPHKHLQKTLGFTKEDVLLAAKRVLAKKPRTYASYADVTRAWKRIRTAEVC